MKSYHLGTTYSCLAYNSVVNKKHVVGQCSEPFVCVTLDMRHLWVVWLLLWLQIPPFISCNYRKKTSYEKAASIFVAMALDTAYKQGMEVQWKVPAFIVPNLQPLFKRREKPWGNSMWTEPRESTPSPGLSFPLLFLSSISSIGLSIKF